MPSPSPLTTLSLPAAFDTSTAAQLKLRPSSSMIFSLSSPAVSSPSLFPTSTTSYASLGKSMPQEGATSSWESMTSTRPASGSLSSIYGSPVLSRFSVSSLQLPMPASSSFAPRRSTEDFSQSQLRLLPTATQSWTPLPTNNSTTEVQQADATTLHPS